MGFLGAYRTTSRITVLVQQSAGTRVFEVCLGGGLNYSSAANGNNGNGVAPAYIVPTRLELAWIQLTSHTATIGDSLDLWKVPATVVVDNVNATTPPGNGDVSIYPSSAPLPAAFIGYIGTASTTPKNGLTGGTFANPDKIDQLGHLLYNGLPPQINVVSKTMIDRKKRRFERLLAGEALILTNRVLFGSAGTADCYVTFAWEEWS